MNFEQRNEITERTFGAFIKSKREKAGLSVRALATKLDISSVYLSDIENFNRPAPRKEEVFAKLVMALNLTEVEEEFLKKAALASRSEDIDIYLKDNPRVCVALRMAQELPDDKASEEWENFIQKLITLNSDKDTTAPDSN